MFIRFDAIHESDEDGHTHRQTLHDGRVALMHGIARKIEKSMMSHTAKMRSPICSDVSDAAPPTTIYISHNNKITS